jgi:hypothetical protein
LAKNKNLNFFKTIYVPSSKPITQPYWLAKKMEEGSFNVDDQLAIGQPDISPAYDARVQLKIDGESFVFNRPVKYKFTDPVKGEIYEPVVVVPPVTLKPSINLAVINGQKAALLDVSVKAYKSISFSDPTLYSTSEQMQGIGYGSFNKDQERTFPVSIPGKEKHTSIKFYIGHPDDSYFKNKHEIKYDHIPYINYFTDATATSLNLDLKTVNKKIGYIIGAGDKVPEALEQMGYEVTLLTD